MFEAIGQPLDEDIEWARTARNLLHIYLYTIFAFQTLTFALIIYLIEFRTPASMAEYRRLLRMNLVTAYLTEFAFILWMPVALPTQYHTISDGLIGRIGGSKLHYVWIFVICTLLTAHCSAIGACVLYQVSMISPVKRRLIRTTLEFLLASDLRFHAIFLGICASMSATCIYYFITRIYVDFEPAEHLDLSIPQDRLLYYEYLKDADSAIYIDFSRIGIFLPLFTCFMVFTIVVSAVGIAYFWCCYHKKPTVVLKRTQQLQRALHKCIIAQTSSLTIFYVIPVELLLTAGTLRLPYAFTLMYVAIASMLTYSPVNHWIIILFVRHFRNEATKTATELTGFGRTRTKVITVRTRSDAATVTMIS